MNSMLFQTPVRPSNTRRYIYDSLGGRYPVYHRDTPRTRRVKSYQPSYHPLAPVRKYLGQPQRTTRRKPKQVKKRCCYYDRKGRKRCSSNKYACYRRKLKYWY